MDSSLQLAPIGQVLAGLGLLFFGRRLFWLFVALIGFFVGAEFARHGLAGSSDMTVLAAAVVCGAVAAVLAVVLQRFAVMVTGGLAGGLMAVRMAPLLGLHTDPGNLVAFVVGALLAAVALAVLFDSALVVVSCLLGATMLAEALPLDPLLAPFVLIVLAIIGGLVQARSLFAERRNRPVAS